MVETAIQCPPEATMTALVVEVPQAEPVVGDFRAVMDPHGANGVNAHVTVLFPFVPPGEVTHAVLDGVRSVVGRFDGFDCDFADVRWFEQQTMWLAPEPVSTFVAMTRALVDRFPDFPPYGGDSGIRCRT